MLEPSPADRGDGVRREPPGEIEAVYLGAQRLAKLRDLNWRNEVTPAAAPKGAAAGVYRQAAEGEAAPPAGKANLWTRGCCG